MLRVLTKLLAALVALGVLLIGILAVALPRIINTEEFRAALRKDAAEALGTPVEWSRLKVGIVPPRLIIEEPVLLSEDSNREEARLTASSIDLRLSAMAMLQRRIQIDSLVLRGVDLVVTRTDEGLILPLSTAQGEEAGESEASSAAVPETPPSGATPADPTHPEVTTQDNISLAFRRFLVTESRITIRDRTLPRPIDWQLGSFEFKATASESDSPDVAAGPFEIEFSALLAADEKEVGAIETTGTVTLDGAYDLDVLLEKIVLAALQPYVTDATLSGLASGRISAEGVEGVTSLVETDLRVENMAVTSFGLDLVGQLDLEARQVRDEPVAFKAAIDLGQQGKATITGTMTQDGSVDAKVGLTSLELGPFAKLAGNEMQIAGSATGQVELAASAEGGLTRLSTDLKVSNARYSDAALEVGGTLDLNLGIEGLGDTDPVRFDVAMDLDGGGHVDAKGTATLGGAVDAKLNIAAVDLKRIAAWVPEGSQVTGELTGMGDIRLTTERRIERLVTKFEVTGARFVSGSVDVTGVFDLAANLGPNGPIELAANLALADRSRISVVGTSTVDGVADVKLSLETFNLALAKPFLPDPEMQLAGRASGKGQLVGAVTAPEFLSFDLGVEGGAFKTAEYSVEGPFLAALKVKEPLSRPRGRLDLDLTAASLRYLDQFAKPAGMRAEMVTRFVPEESGEIVFESQLKLRNIDEVLLQGTIGDTSSVSMTTSRFNLAGWSEVFPILETYQADGMIELDGVAVVLVDGAPRKFGGRIGLNGVGLVLTNVGRVRFRGAILGEESTIRVEGLKALIGEVTLGLKGVVEDPLGKGEFDFSVETLGDAEVNHLLSELTSVKDVVFGALKLGGELQGSYGGTAATMQTLTGDLRFSIGEKGGGRLRGVSILRSILDQFPLLGGAARLSAPFRGGRSVDDYYTERFEIIEGDFIVAGGKIDARKLRLSYPGYEAHLTGPMRLRDFQIDMTGEVILKGDLVSAMGGASADRKPIQIKLARVTNTLNDPKIKMTAETLAAIPKLLFQATGVDRIAVGVGKKVGEAIGRVVGGGKQPAPAR